MAKLHLVAKVPNEAARRLAWWLGEEERAAAGAIERLARDLRVERGTIDRLLAGELEPGSDLSFMISTATAHAVVTRDWRVPAEGGWFKRPTIRQYLAAA